MKWVLIIVVLFVQNSLSSQNLLLELKGNTQKEDSLLKPYQAQNRFKDFLELQVFSEDVLEKLQGFGYYNLRYQELSAVNDSVFQLKIDLRKRYGYVFIRNIKDLKGIHPIQDSVIQTENLQPRLYKILNDLSTQGKPFSQIQLKDVEITDSDTISATVVLETSKKRIIDNIIVRGYDNIPAAFIKNYAGIKKGDVYNREKLIQDAERLDQLNFLEQSKSPQVLFTPDSTKLYLYFKKTNANSFDGFLGFNNSDDNDVQLIGNVDLRLLNNFNYGEEFKLNYKNDGNQQEKFTLGLRLPYILNSRFSLEGQLDFFRQDSTFSNSKQNLKVDYQINRNINTGLLVEFEESSNLLSSADEREDIADFTKDKYGLNFYFLNPKRLNPLFLPSQYLNLELGFANRNSNQMLQRQKFATLKGRYIVQIGKRQYLYSGLEAAFLSSNEYLTNELYRFGGINNIRGFAENRFFAHMYGILQTEYRYVLGSNLFIHSVLDYGLYENAVNNFDDSLYSVGVGIGLQTNAGILRFIAANGGSSSQNIEFRNTQIHIKFITIF
jgi:outer membrane protein assembly factor BamA